MQLVKKGGPVLMPASALGRHPLSFRFTFLFWKMAGTATPSSEIMACDNACAVYTGSHTAGPRLIWHLLLVNTE